MPNLQYDPAEIRQLLLKKLAALKKLPGASKTFSAGAKPRRRGGLKGGKATIKRGPLRNSVTGSGLVRAGASKRGPSPWIAHLKAYVAKHGCTYREAMKLAKPSYKPAGGSRAGSRAAGKPKRKAVAARK